MAHGIGVTLTEALVLTRGRQSLAVDGLDLVLAVLGWDEVSVSPLPVNLGHQEKATELLLLCRGAEKHCNMTP